MVCSVSLPPSLLSSRHGHHPLFLIDSYQKWEKAIRKRGWQHETTLLPHLRFFSPFSCRLCACMHDCDIQVCTYLNQHTVTLPSLTVSTLSLSHLSQSAHCHPPISHSQYFVTLSSLTVSTLSPSHLSQSVLCHSLISHGQHTVTLPSLTASTLSPSHLSQPTRSPSHLSQPAHSPSQFSPL